MEDSPDLRKLHELGKKIEIIVSQIEEHWNKLYNLNPNDVKMLTMYGTFLTDVMNDETGKETLGSSQIHRKIKF